MSENSDHYWMQYALILAEKAQAQGEVPIGAVVVLENKLIGEGWNQPIQSHDPSAHAEVVAIRQAAKTIQNYRLINTTLYTTLQPCSMCMGLMVHARIQRCVYGAADHKSGHVNHQLAMFGGVLEVDCRHILQQFFLAKR